MSAPATKASVGLLKRAWNEIPEVIGSSFMGLVGIGLGVTAVCIYNQKDGDIRRHKYEYVVVRSDDPRAKTRKDY